MDIYLNGKMVPPDEAKINIRDTGLQHAVGLFETMTVQQGKVFRLHEHLKRLQISATQLGLAKKIQVDALAQAITQTIEHNHATEARLRLTLTGGELSLLKTATPKPPLPTLIIQMDPPTLYDPKYFEEGIRVMIAPPGANPFDATAGHKTLNYWQRLRTLRQAASAGAGEAIWLNISNHLASGSISNLFLVKDNQLHTPYARGEEVKGALPAPVLPGITRQAIIEIAHQMGIRVERKMLTVEDMLNADEVFLTNSGWQLLPVSQVEKHTLGNGQAGELSKQLRHKLLELIQQETAPDSSAHRDSAVE